jgi:hypothetical protein
MAPLTGTLTLSGGQVIGRTGNQGPMNRDELIIASFCLIDDLLPIFCETTSRPCGWGVGTRLIATLSGGQVIGVGPRHNHPQG